MAEKELTRDEEIKAIWANKETRLIYKLLGGIVLIGIGVLVGRLIYATPEAGEAWGFGMNLFTGVISTAATVLILDQLAERRADRKAGEALKRQLIDDAASLSNEVAKNAVHQMRRRGWLDGEHGLLKGANLIRANLQNADLFRANLHQVNLSAANLQEVTLITTDLAGASLQWARLQAGNLSGANLEGANLFAAHLEGANLQGANLRSASFNGTTFDESTVLPDGSLWSSETDMERFTDPDHPDFVSYSSEAWLFKARAMKPDA